MFVCYNYADNFLHLCIETYESQTCLTLAKNSSIVEKFLTFFRPQYGVNFLKKTNLVFWRNGLLFFFFEESASQTRASSRVSTV